MTKRPQPQQSCVVTIDHYSYVMPMANGLKLVDIMAKAAPIERTYASGRKKWVLRTPSAVEVGCELIRHDDIELVKVPSARLALPGASS